MTTTETLYERILEGEEGRAYTAGRIGIAIGMLRDSGVAPDALVELEEALEACAPKPEE